MASQVITANRLDDGLVVFLKSDMSWDKDINQASLLDDVDQANQLIEQVSVGDYPQQVVGPYLIEVEINEKHVKPLKYRERIRTLGPTVRTDLGYQSGQ